MKEGGIADTCSTKESLAIYTLNSVNMNGRDYFEDLSIDVKIM
jgi:hypothetical protein